MKYIIMTVLSIALFMGAYGESQARSIAAGGCTTQENVSINVSFNGIADKAAEVLEIVTNQENAIMAFAKDLGIEDIKITSQNFSINSNRNYNNYGNKGNYQYSGSISLKLSPYDKALILLDQLKEDSYSNVSVNVNRYSQGNC